jgi:protease-4
MAKRGLVIVLTLLGIAVFLSFAAFGALYFFLGRAPAVPSRAMLILDVGGDLAESAPADVVTFIRGARTPTVRTIVETMRKAKTDSRVSALLLEPTGFSAPYWGKVQEIRDAVLDFKSSGKPVYAYLQYADERNYYLATAADRIFLMPSAPLDLTGVATYAVFLRGTFDKLGIVPDMHHIGDYKTAINAYTEKTYTAAHKEMDESLNRDLFEQIVRGVAEARRKTDEEVRGLIDEGPFLADAALRAGLIDEIGYHDQVEDRLREDHGTDMTALKSEDYARARPRPFGRANRAPRVAVIYASGAIVDGKGGFDPLNGEMVGSDTLVEAIRSARKDNAVRAIVLRVDSPGGSATASDAIWRELMLAKQEKANRPLVVSMSDLAASGGYYIAMPAETIVAQPSTLTGSIGIFGGKLVPAGLYEKIGANVESTSIGRNAEMGSPARPFNQSELQKVQEQLQAFYSQFVRKAAESRHTTPEQLDRLAQGRVWTGRQAKENGLIDELGGLDRALAIAKDRAKIPADSDVELVTYPRPKTFFEMVNDTVSGSSDRAISAWVSSHLSSDEIAALRALRGSTGMFRRGELLALMPLTYLR